ncbi:sodium/potassium/calcium exchanger 3 [Nilaparvata lugens]|uniref:sodium/potassium/calcium exchanger 3 n=1 Tax=Nilaparvata lugens TaxID=108931 RepID=UPI00193D6E61|nr:sodium/potassium/calcium exchanger 3 [Nilaparvata lugens]XP_022194839.2 sodium/potassium/calcium exchanger 3 [Nilaparvata lugens]XP_022194840.2 sodium/potassium/calcium exchanger 3 [Nilaparvata lugens]
MLEWKKREDSCSKFRMTASKLILIPIAFLIINTVSQFWNIHTSRRELHDDHFSAGRRSILSTEDDEGDNCTKPTIMDFPQIKFPGGENGRLIFPLLISIYIYFLLAKICDDYFIGCIKVICSKIGFSGDVAGATLMAAATSSPELFIHLVGTFVTHTNLGIGTIVGSVVINVLGVPGLCGVFSPDTKVMLLDVWPLVRDGVMYCFSLTTITFFLRDKVIYWYEAGSMVLIYLLYLLVMSKNNILRTKFDTFICRFKSTPNPWESNVTWPLLHNKDGVEGPVGNGHKVHLEDFGDETEVEEEHLCCWPSGAGFWSKIGWLLTLPINTALKFTIPNCHRTEHARKFYVLTFIMCMCWIAVSCYTIAWMITITGFVLKVPDSVMGLTFIAAGMSIPETISSIIVAKQGQGSMAIANLLGSNIFNMLFCFGLPWFIKSAFFMDVPGYFIHVNCQGLNYYISALFIAIAVLLSTLAANKFVLNKLVGYICITVYILFIVCLVFLELFYLDDEGPPMCSTD